MQSMATILTILTVGYCLILSQHSNFLVLAGRGEHRVFGILTAVEAVLCVSTAIFTVTVLGWGLTGIAWSNLIPMALVAGVIIPIYFNRKMKISAWESIRHVWRPALLSTAPSVLLIVVWKYLAPPDSWLDLFAVVVAAAAQRSFPPGSSAWTARSTATAFGPADAAPDRQLGRPRLRSTAR